VTWLATAKSYNKHNDENLYRQYSNIFMWLTMVIMLHSSINLLYLTEITAPQNYPNKLLKSSRAEVFMSFLMHN